MAMTYDSGNENQSLAVARVAGRMQILACDEVFTIRVSIKELPVPASCDTLRHRVSAGAGRRKGKNWTWLDRRVIGE